MSFLLPVGVRWWMPLHSDSSISRILSISFAVPFRVIEFDTPPRLEVVKFLKVRNRVLNINLLQKKGDAQQQQQPKGEERGEIGQGRAYNCTTCPK